MSRLATNDSAIPAPAHQTGTCTRRSLSFTAATGAGAGALFATVTIAVAAALAALGWASTAHAYQVTLSDLGASGGGNLHLHHLGTESISMTGNSDFVYMTPLPASHQGGCAVEDTRLACPRALVKSLSIGADDAGSTAATTIVAGGLSVSHVTAVMGQGDDSLTLRGSAGSVSITEASEAQGGNDTYDLAGVTDLTSCAAALGPGKDLLRAATVLCQVDGGDGAEDGVDFGTVTTGLIVTFTGSNTAAVAGLLRLVGVEEVAGGSANDALTGADNRQVLRGGPGDDILTGGGGSDLLFGDGGNDDLRAADETADKVDCGAGSDVGTIDTIDEVLGCERTIVPALLVTFPPAPPADTSTPAAPVVQVTSRLPSQRMRVLAGVQTSFTTTRAGTRITRMRLTDLPAKATVEVRCRGSRRCPFRTLRRTNARAGGSLTLTPAFKRRRLPRGAVIEVRVRQAGIIGRLVRLTMWANRPPRRTTLCLAAGSGRVQHC